MNPSHSAMAQHGADGASPSRTRAASRLLARAARAPFVHFLLLGGLLFAVDPWRGPKEPGQTPAERAPIVFTASDVDKLRHEWALQYGSPPSPDDEEALLKDAIDEEILYREAVGLGFDRDDRVVRNRLANLGRLLDLAPEGDEEALVREARAAQLERADLVIRRHLVEMMRLAAAKPQPSDVPSESELRQYYESHSADLAEPARVRLRHVYLSPERHGDAVEKDALRLLEELRREGTAKGDGSSLGDAFIRGNDVPLASRARLERIFGPGFAGEIEVAPLRAWTGPVRSSYGLHLVWVDERIPAEVPPLGAVRNRVVLEIIRKRAEERLQASMRTLRAKYEVEIERGGSGNS